MPKNRSQRLRKKLRVDEFKEFGFLITFSLSSEIDGKSENAFVDRFLAEAIEANGLVFGGGIGETTEGFATLNKRGTAIEEHRQQVKNWLSAQAEVSNIKVGELQNAWI